MPPRNLLACKSDDREQRAVVPGLRALSSRFTQGQAPDTCGCLYPWIPQRETLAWRRSRRSLRACSGPTSSSAPLAQSRRAAATPSKGYWVAAPPSLGTCLGRGHPLPTSQTTPPSRLSHPAGHPCLCTPSPIDLGSPAQRPQAPTRVGVGCAPAAPPAPGSAVRAGAAGALTHSPPGRGFVRRSSCTRRGGAVSVGLWRPGSARSGCRRPREDVTGPRVAHTLRRPGSLLRRPPAPPASGVHPPRTAPPPAGGGVASAVRCQANRGRGLPLVCPAPRAAARPLAPARFSLGNNCRRTCE